MTTYNIDVIQVEGILFWFSSPQPSLSIKIMTHTNRPKLLPLLSETNLNNKTSKADTNSPIQILVVHHSIN